MPIHVIVTVSEIQTEEDVALFQEATRRGYTHPYFLGAGLMALSKVDLPAPLLVEQMGLINQVREYPRSRVANWTQQFGGKEVRAHYYNLPQETEEIEEVK